MVTETVTVRMSRGEANTAWGFRLHGGAEFHKPLSIEKVVQGSLADRAGLKLGDTVKTVAGRPTDSLSHTDAQNAIRSAGNNLDLIVTRQASYRQWQPMITPTDQGVNVSLKHHQSSTHTSSTGASHNVAPRPFGGHSGGLHSTHTDLQQALPVNVTHQSQHKESSGVQHLQYNSPADIYSSESKVEAYKTQTGQSGGQPGQGADDKPYLHSKTLEALREEESHGIKPTYTGDYHDALHHTRGHEQSSSFNRLSHALHTEEHHESHGGGGAPHAPPECANCGKPVTGMYAKASGMVFHADCYNCATCGNSLKNSGYHLLNNKLYCDIHARQVQSMRYGGEPVPPAAFFPPAAPLQPQSLHSPGSNQPEIYQPEVMSKSPARPFVRSTIDPHSHGVPTRPADHGSHTVTNVTHTTSITDHRDHGGHGHASVPMPAPAPSAPVTRPATKTTTSVRTTVWPPPKEQDGVVPLWNISLHRPAGNEPQEQLYPSKTITYKAYRSSSHLQKMTTYGPDGELLVYFFEQSTGKTYDKNGDEIEVYTITKRKSGDQTQRRLNLELEIPDSGLVPPANFSIDSGLISPSEYRAIKQYAYVDTLEAKQLTDAATSPHIPPSGGAPPPPLPKTPPPAISPTSAQKRNEPRPILVPDDVPQESIYVPENSKSKQTRGQRSFATYKSDNQQVAPKLPETWPPQAPPIPPSPTYGLRPEQKKPTPKARGTKPLPEKPKEQTGPARNVTPDNKWKYEESIVNRWKQQEARNGPVTEVAQPEVKVYPSDWPILSRHAPSKLQNMIDTFEPPVAADAPMSTAKHDDLVVKSALKQSILTRAAKKTSSTSNNRISTTYNFTSATKTLAGENAPAVAQSSPVPKPRGFETRKLELTASDLVSKAIQDASGDAPPKPSRYSALFAEAYPTEEKSVSEATFWNKPSDLSEDGLAVTPARSLQDVNSECSSLLTDTVSHLKHDRPTMHYKSEMRSMENIGGSHMTSSSIHTETTQKSASGTGASGQQFSTPRRGRGILKQLGDHPRIPVCEQCNKEIRGPFVLALNSTWCPDHFTCANGSCGRKLLDIGFVEESDNIYCEFCFEQYFAPRCGRCSKAIVGDSLRALNQSWHPDCFTCSYCHKAFGREAFFLEDGKPYCEADWNKLYTTKCVSCQFPIEAGDRWVEALGNAYHSECFTCSTCQKNLEGLTFFSKGGKPFCKQHA